jgi:integrase/recombinase XerD
MGGKPVWCRTAPGPLEPYADGYARWLADQGFSQGRIERRVDQLGHLSHWLAIEGLGPDALTAERQLRFSEARRAAGYRTWLSPRSLRVPLAYLRDAGLIAVPAVVVPEGPVGRLVEDYRRYLAGERGLVAHTIENYERVARLFLAGREQLGAGLGLERLAAQDVSAFLACECPKRSAPAPGI